MRKWGVASLHRAEASREELPVFITGTESALTLEEWEGRADVIAFRVPSLDGIPLLLMLPVGDLYNLMERYEALTQAERS